MHSGWNTWLHLGIKRSVSSSSNSFKHTAHSSVARPILRLLTVEYTKVGNVSMTSRSRPRWRRAIGMERSNLPLILRSAHCLVYTERNPRMKNTATRITRTMAMDLSNFSFENLLSGGGGVSVLGSCAVAGDGNCESQWTLLISSTLRYNNFKAG
ncbi:hypothetical protein CR513_35153, partial [Mucuna pruriens]